MYVFVAHATRFTEYHLRKDTVPFRSPSELDVLGWVIIGKFNRIGEVLACSRVNPSPVLSYGRWDTKDSGEGALKSVIETERVKC